VSTGIELAERGLVPDAAIRWGIRRLLRQRVRIESGRGIEEQQERFREFRSSIDSSPLAVNTADANIQHYEVPAEYFATVLGPHRKYSCCLYASPDTPLQQAEAAMLDLTCQRAGIADGQSVLELGCGWGSLSLWMASRYPGARVTAVSNSNSQREYIEQQARNRGLGNLRVITADMNGFDADPAAYDRCVSVEMFEHMRNYRELFRRIAGWLKPGGRMFTHVFVHREVAYPFEIDGQNDWMAKHFFTGGTMPSAHLFTHYQSDLRLLDQWHVCGVHYSRTLEAWLKLHDSNRERIRGIFRGCYPPGEADRMFHRWRVFYLACSELFAYGGGREWFVSHFLFERPGT
jgi:cyclopropane-fatty-acyl-phospholipid synthase